jgi:hypothetical protein
MVKCTSLTSLVVAGVMILGSSTVLAQAPPLPANETGVVPDQIVTNECHWVELTNQYIPQVDSDWIEYYDVGGSLRGRAQANMSATDNLVLAAGDAWEDALQGDTRTNVAATGLRTWTWEHPVSGGRVTVVYAICGVRPTIDLLDADCAVQAAVAARYRNSNPALVVTAQMNYCAETTAQNFGAITVTLAGISLTMNVIGPSLGVGRYTDSRLESGVIDGPSDFTAIYHTTYGNLTVVADGAWLLGDYGACAARFSGAVRSKTLLRHVAP